MKAGRKRKPGRRYASGDRMKTVREDESRRVALEARMRIFGVGRELAGRDIMGSPLGRLLHWNIITPAQADAGYNFALTMRAYLRASEGQRPGQSRASFVPPAHGTAANRCPERFEKTARSFMEALTAVDSLDPASPSATSIMWDVCVFEHDRMRVRELCLLRLGLNAIARVIHGGAGRKTHDDPAPSGRIRPSSCPAVPPGGRKF
jgi:hypothetical protein